MNQLRLSVFVTSVFLSCVLLLPYWRRELRRSSASVEASQRELWRNASFAGGVGSLRQETQRRRYQGKVEHGVGVLRELEEETLLAFGATERRLSR